MAVPPQYFIENRYSFVIDALPFIDKVHYEAETAESGYSVSIQVQLAAANRLLMAGKHSAALAQYLHIRGVVGNLINPKLPVRNATLVDWATLNTSLVVDTIVAKSAELLSKTPPPRSVVPAAFRGSDVTLPASVATSLALFEQVGVQHADADVEIEIQRAANLMKDGNFAGAAEVFQAAAQSTADPELQGAILHDAAIMQERAGKRAEALQTLDASVRTFADAKSFESQALALTSLAGVQARGGDAEATKVTQATLDRLLKDQSVFEVLGGDVPIRSTEGIGAFSTLVGAATVAPVRNGLALGSLITRTPNGTQTLASARARRLSGGVGPGQGSAALMAADTFATRARAATLAILAGDGAAQQIKLGAQGAANLGSFYTTLSQTRDIELLMGYLWNPSTTTAYLSHVFSWVLPMAIGDCYAALGSYAEAEKEYLSTRGYKYLNTVVESVNLWLRLAELYVDWGDRLYRDARNDATRFGPAKEMYERVLRLDNSVDDNSPLYASPIFGAMSVRARGAIKAMFVDRVAVEDNPRMAIVLARARMQLTKIDGGLNFIGIGLHTPPFSFEHLQNLARYFAQHASQVEQMYIQFKSSGESEELREQQMAQQVEIAAASVELEQRGVNEAQEGVDVAEANQNQATVQANNAAQAAQDFANVRWELLELDTLTTWANASAVDRDDQVKLTISGYDYYSANGKRRNVVLKELSEQRTRLSHDLEEARLDREIDAANAYVATAQQQRQQAEARVAVAQQRVVIAGLQQQHAQENLDFLVGREFTAAMWYDLARESRRLAGRYLDMAIEAATFMEKAYEAETGRDLAKIKFEYGLSDLNSLLGAEALLLDIDYFSLDYVRTKAKKAPMRQTISLADQFPMAYNRLLRTGTTYFETTLEHFDRRYPGFYLQKLKQVEVVFVGLNGGEGVHGMLRNIGLSQFRQKTGQIVDQTYPADVMPLSEYNVRQDAIVFALDSKELRLFENNGVATMWQLDLPLSSNTFDLRQILDIHMVVYYDGYFDAGLEGQILAGLPASGSASRGLSLRMNAPDELFFLRSQGAAELRITPDQFPANHTNARLLNYSIQAQGAGVAGLKVNVGFENLASTATFTLDADGLADGATFPGPIGQTLFDTWSIAIDPAANASFDVSALEDLSVFAEYSFDYRS